MVRHIVMWNFVEGFTHEENMANAKKVKEILEALPSKIDGIVSLEVIINPIDTSNRAVILNSLFENEEALANYSPHPEHVNAGKFVRSVLTDRACADFIEL